MAMTDRESLKFLDALMTVRDYLWDDELSRFQGEPTADHIFRHLAVLENWLSSTARTAEDFAAAAEGEPSPR